MPDRYEKGSPPTEEDFTGHVKDNSTQLHYAGARYYSAAFARWTTTEPLLQSQSPRKLLKDGKGRLLSGSPYGYSLNNPANLRDPDGRCPICVAAWAAVEIGLAAYDAYNAYQTYTNPNATAKEKANSLRMAAIGAIGPGGGLTALTKADDVADVARGLNKIDSGPGKWMRPAVGVSAPSSPQLVSGPERQGLRVQGGRRSAADRRPSGRREQRGDEALRRCPGARLWAVVKRGIALCCGSRFPCFRSCWYGIEGPQEEGGKT
jgi:RHS repeat-associated protein